jgi:hypothetical protein
MSEKELYEEDLENPYSISRREFLKKGLQTLATVAGTAALTSSIMPLISCKDNGGSPVGPIIENPATEEEGKVAMKDAADAVMGEKGYTYEIKYDVEVYILNNDERGRFDAVVYADTDGNGQYDLRLGMNYVTEGESRQNLQDTARYKFKEIVKSDITTKSYLTEEFKKWMRDVA